MMICEPKSLDVRDTIASEFIAKTLKFARAREARSDYQNTFDHNRNIAPRLRHHSSRRCCFCSSCQSFQKEFPPTRDFVQSGIREMGGIKVYSQVDPVEQYGG